MDKIRLLKEYALAKINLATKYRNSDRVALASFPRSGNTWTRVLLESATGELAGSIYKDKVYQRGAEGIVIKTHARDSYRYNKAIILVRHPLDSFVSHFKWRQDFGKKEVIEWDEHIDRCIRMWGNFYKHWGKVAYPVHILKYEDLRLDTELHLSALLAFLDRSVDKSKILQAISNSDISKMKTNAEAGKAGRSFFNSGDINKGHSQFSDKELKLIKEKLGRIASKFEYEI